MQKNTYFDNVLDKIYELPLWVKQAIYAELKEHIQSRSPICALDTISKHNLIQLYTPFITQAGIKVLSKDDTSLIIDKSKITNEVISLLTNAKNKLRIIDICQKNTWTLSQACKTITDCIDLNLIEPIASNSLSSTIYFIAGKIRIGEFLVRTGKISVEQLDMALYSQKYTEDSMGERIYLAQILLNLGYISPRDYENIIFLKDYGNELYTEAFNENISEMTNNVDNLKQEVISLRNERLKLRKSISQSSEDAKTIASLLTKIDTLKKSLKTFETENDNAKRDLNLYLDELVALSQENIELKEQLENISN
ncbi:MAG: hypothetical protein AB1782_04635 [Cyanobacteriota bacterium]